jgi:riboflavin kinase / FMN adenylyltransferase
MDDIAPALFFENGQTGQTGSSRGFVHSDLILYFRNSFSIMQVHRNSTSFPPFRQAVVTIGTFDGVHTGHQQIIEQLKNEASRIHGETVIITFHPHPRKIVNSSSNIKLINTLEEKIELLADRGIDHLVIVPFTESFSQLTAQEYIREFLVEKFHPHTIIIGYDHRFGKERKGDFHMMEDFSEAFGYVLLEIPVHVLHAISVSSTRIREAVSRGEVEAANELLGYDFFFEGKVVVGNKLGRTIGYPTANLQVENEEKLLPGDGVYAVKVELGVHSGSTQKSYAGMMNIGMRPTIDGSTRVIEVNIFDFEGDLYGQTLRVYSKRHLRGEQKFNGLEALKQQLTKDKQQAASLLSDPTK